VSEALLLRWFRKNYEGLFILDYSKRIRVEAINGLEQPTKTGPKEFWSFAIFHLMPTWWVLAMTWPVKPNGQWKIINGN